MRAADPTADVRRAIEKYGFSAFGCPDRTNHACNRGALPAKAKNGKPTRSPKARSAKSPVHLGRPLTPPATPIGKHSGGE